ncbi:PilN domain-containing protein [Thermosulfurimonas sp.]|uniref:PilN domain-containing protein n=1 Tax=Thermosulfurimonas sp. TaxID=2080236 RepID=UPI0025DD8A4D|nr:PilN domain-containing protein [Thermosulfurimonas sp.]
MIKINFVREVKEKRALAFSWVKLYLGALVVLVSLLLGSLVWMHQELSSREARLDRLEMEKRKYALLAKKVQALKKEDQELRTRIQTILDLKRRRGQLLRVFDQVILSLPAGKMYLVNLSLDMHRVVLSGFALDYQNVATFLKTLEEKPIFKKVDLFYTRKKKIGEYDLVEFKIGLGF